jgi:hypothetical protein
VDITFQDAPPSSRRLRRRAKAAVYLHVASRMSRDPDQRHRAARLATQAVTLHPRLLMTRRCAVALTSGAREVIRARTTVPSSG